MLSFGRNVFPEKDQYDNFQALTQQLILLQIFVANLLESLTMNRAIPNALDLRVYNSFVALQNQHLFFL